MVRHREQTLIIVVGPNASGKSALAVRLAKKIGGEVISADSRQVYRGLDIGTGKITLWDMRGVRHHLIDVASPTRQFSVADFQFHARAAIREIAGRSKVPILAGGTGFWIDAVAYNLELPAVPPNPKLRRTLGKKSAAKLLATLKKLDPERARAIEVKNPRRLIRAIEVAKALGRVPPITRRSPYRILWIGVQLPSAVLRRRIHRRLSERIRRGMIAEAGRLRAGGLSWRRFYELGLEYRFLADYLRGNVTKREMVEKLEGAIGHYARRQMAWFKRNPDIRWLRTARAAEELTRRFLAE